MLGIFNWEKRDCGTVGNNEDKNKNDKNNEKKYMGRDQTFFHLQMSRYKV